MQRSRVRLAPSSRQPSSASPVDRSTWTPPAPCARTPRTQRCASPASSSTTPTVAACPSTSSRRPHAPPYGTHSAARRGPERATAHTRTSSRRLGSSVTAPPHAPTRIAPPGVAVTTAHWAPRSSSPTAGKASSRVSSGVVWAPRTLPAASTSKAVATRRGERDVADSAATPPSRVGTTSHASAPPRVHPPTPGSIPVSARAVRPRIHASVPAGPRSATSAPRPAPSTTRSPPPAPSTSAVAGARIPSACQITCATPTLDRAAAAPTLQCARPPSRRGDGDAAPTSSQRSDTVAASSSEARRGRSSTAPAASPSSGSRMGPQPSTRATSSTVQPPSSHTPSGCGESLTARSEAPTGTRAQNSPPLTVRQSDASRAPKATPRCASAKATDRAPSGSTEVNHGPSGEPVASMRCSPASTTPRSEPSRVQSSVAPKRIPSGGATSRVAPVSVSTVT